MKKLMCLVAILACAACSSATKKDEAASTEAPVVTHEETTTAPVKEEKAAKSTAKKESSSSDFPAITGTEKSSVSCTNKSDTRKITILNVTEGGCGVVYNKAGEDKTVAMAKASADYCDTVSNKIKTNLEGAGFDCGGGAAATEEKPADTGTSSDTQQTK
jgi:hypothetical protein